MTVAVDAREEAMSRLTTAFKGTLTAIRRLRGREAQRPDELSFAQYHLLFGLAEHAELSTSELALRAELAPATATQMLDALVAMGLVERTRSDRDRRVVTCALTDRGSELIASRRGELERRWRELLADIGTEDLAAAAAVLERLRVFHEELAAGGKPHEDSSSRSRSNSDS